MKVAQNRIVIEMSDATSAYSIAVAPFSSFKNRWTRFRITLTPRRDFIWWIACRVSRA